MKESDMKDALEGRVVAVDLEGEVGSNATSGEPGSHVALGRLGEEVALCFLECAGYEILETNWSCIAGEADIIARDENSLHFIEVKTRRGTGKGFPEEAVDAAKRRRYERIAELYLQRSEPFDCSVHFDVISLLVFEGSRCFMKVYHNAFSCDG